MTLLEILFVIGSLICSFLVARSFIVPKAAPEGFDPNEREAAEARSHLERQIQQLKNKIDLIEEHSGEYFYVLHDRGWKRVIEIFEGLERSKILVGKLITDGEFVEAKALAMRLCSTYESPDMSDDPRYPELSGLNQWEPETNGIIACVATELAAAAADTKQMGISRNKRKPTLAAVDELRRLLKEQYQPKPNIKDW